MKTIAFFLAMTTIAFSLPGCSDPSKPMISTKLAMATLPHECVASDASWINPPDADEKRSETARRERKNKNSFTSMRADRRICRAGLKAIQQGN